MRTVVKSAKSPFRALLLKKRSELLESVRNEPEALTAIQTPDAVEFATRTADQDLAAITANLRRRMLKEVESALQRMTSGNYGACEGCGEEISHLRLKALPWARFCVACQEPRSRN